MNVVHIILFLVSVCCVDVGVTDNKRANAGMTHKRRRMRIRCTRRYTPGSCLKPVGPVWTFLAPLQSCQERLGCPADSYANRFNSFEECASVCRELIYLFMFLQSSFDNDTFKVPTEVQEGLDDGGRPAEINAIYSHFVDRGDDSSEEDTDEEVPNIDHDFRRELNEAISALPWNPLSEQEWEPDYSEEDQTSSEEPSDDRPPLPSREELTPDDDLIEPDIDNFPES